MSCKFYNYNDHTQITKNFNVSEFRCKCGGTHQTKLWTEIVEMLQKLADTINADCVYISSGYRCSTHDRNVGGYGSGPHVDGIAADCQFIKDGKPVSTKLLSCIAQDLGFMGIANITWDYAWIHLDMKGRVYKGNETINYNTLTSDFYSYYGITRDQVKALTGSYIPNNNVSTNKNVTVNEKDNAIKIIWSNTYDADVVELQKILNEKGFHLSEDGFAGPNTYDVLKKFTIEQNDSGPLTAWVQKKLKNLGFYDGMLDGVAGISTMDAIKKFQKENGLGEGYMGGTDYVYLLGGKVKK